MTSPREDKYPPNLPAHLRDHLAYRITLPTGHADENGVPTVLNYAVTVGDLLDEIAALRSRGQVAFRCSCGSHEYLTAIRCCSCGFEYPPTTPTASGEGDKA